MTSIRRLVPALDVTQNLPADDIDGTSHMLFDQTIKSTEAAQDKTSTIDKPGYDPDRLLDTLIGKLRLKNDAALSRALEVAPPIISKIRRRRTPVGAPLLIRMHEVSKLSIKDLRVLMGDRRNKFRFSDKSFKPKEAQQGHC